MSKAYKSIRRGLEQAIAHQAGKPVRAKLHTPSPVDVKQVRARTGLTQEEFAAKFSISLGTLRTTEHHRQGTKGSIEGAGCMTSNLSCRSLLPLAGEGAEGG
jgi:DNA-binding transcriptional regulator YiaG